MPRLNVDGTEYEIPNLNDMDMEQARILKRYTGRALSEIEDMPASDPDFMAALCHIALLIDNPTRSFASIEKQVNATKLATLFVGDPDDTEAAEVPLEPTPSVPNDSGSSSAGELSPRSSGETSEESSDASPETNLRSIGQAG